MGWQPDVDHLTNEDFHERAHMTGQFDVDYKLGLLTAEKKIALHDRAAIIILREAISQLDAAGNPPASASHIAKLLDWMKRWSNTEGKRLLKDSSKQEEANIVQQSTESGVIGLTLSRIGQSMTDIITGKANPLAMLL